MSLSSLSKFIVALSLVAGSIGLAGSTSAWAEACNNGICATSVTSGNFVSVQYRVENGPVSHVNIHSSEFPVKNCNGICPDPFQKEGTPSGSFTLVKSKTGPTTYAIQACVRGGFLQKSSCGRWASFHHDA